VLRLIKKFVYRLFEEDAAQHGDFKTAVYWLKRGQELR
jgi:hypothetical protein